MPDIPELAQENELIDMLISVLEQNLRKSSLSFGSLAADWKKSLQDTKDVNTLILESDPAQLRVDLERESELLAAFVAVLDGSSAPTSELSRQLRDRWYDLFTRERDRNKEIIEATGG